MMFITSCGYIDESGFGSSRSHWTWEDVNCAGLADLRWRMISDKLFDRFGRLDLFSKLALAAVETLQLEIPGKNIRHPDMGISLGSQFGSFEVDVNFMRSKKGAGGGSPILFPYTLPSTAIGEIAIRYRIMGPNTCFLAGTDSGLLALWEGIYLVESGEVNSCICVGCDGISVTSDLFAGQQLYNEDDFRCCAYAFLIENKDSSRKHSRTPLAQIGIEHNSNLVGTRLSTSNSYKELNELYEFLSEVGTSSEVLRLTSPGTLGIASTLAVHHK